MSSIDNSRELDKIKEIADRIHADNYMNGVFIEGPSGVTDYISDYRFDTPIELTESLIPFGTSWEKNV